MTRLPTIATILFLALAVSAVAQNPIVTRELTEPWGLIHTTSSTLDLDTGVIDTVGVIAIDVSASSITTIFLEAEVVNDMHGVLLQTIDGDVSSDGTSITFAVERLGGGDLTVFFSDGYSTLATPPATVELTAGSDTSPQQNFVYYPRSTKVLTASTVGFPGAEHSPIATIIVQSAAKVQTDGTLKTHFWTDHTQGTDNQGHVSHINAWIRSRHATWISGNTQVYTIDTNVGTPDDVFLDTSSGIVKQLHPHVSKAYDMSGGTDHAHVINDSGTPFTEVASLSGLLTDSAGGSMSGRYFTLVIWATASHKDIDSHLFVNLPGGSYVRQADAEADISMFTSFAFPSAYKGAAFLVSAWTLKHSVASGGTWTSITEANLLGLEPSGTVGGGTTTQQTEFADNVFMVFDESDSTKEMQFQLSGVSTGNTRVLTVQDADGTLAYTADLHAESHVIASHSDTSATGAYLDALVAAITPLAGNVGIGKSPSFALDVNGQSHLGAADNQTPNAGGTGGQVLFNGSGYMGWVALDGTAMYVGHNSGARSLVLQTNETDRLTIAAGGAVTLDNSLQVDGNIDLQGVLSDSDSSEVTVGDGMIINGILSIEGVISDISDPEVTIDDNLDVLGVASAVSVVVGGTTAVDDLTVYNTGVAGITIQSDGSSSADPTLILIGGSFNSRIRYDRSATDLYIENTRGNSASDIYLSGDGNINFRDRSSSTNRMTVKTATGNVGFGTDNPGSNVAGGAADFSGTSLHLKNSGGEANFIVEGDFPTLSLIDLGGAADDKVLRLRVDSGVAVFGSRQDDLTPLRSNILTMDLGTGFVGLGTQPGTKQLEVSGTMDVTGAVTFNGTLGVETSIFDISGDTLTISDNLRISGGGLLKSPTGATVMTLLADDATFADDVTVSGVLTVGVDDGTDDTFQLGGGVMTWDEVPGEFDFSAGVRVVGQSDVTANLNADYPFTVVNNNAGVNAWGVLIKSGVPAASITALDNAAISFETSDGVFQGGIAWDDSGTPFFVASSDERLKDGITTTAIRGLAAVRGISGRRFRWDNQGENAKFVEGFVAQEVLAYVPEAIGLRYPSSTASTPMYTMAESKLIKVLWQALRESDSIVQDQGREIERQKRKDVEQDARLEAIEKALGTR